jgi:hypothetical protein
MSVVGDQDAAPTKGDRSRPAAARKHGVTDTKG